MAKEYDALLHRTRPDFKEEIHEDLVDEALQGSLFEDIEVPPDEDMDLPQVHLVKGNNICFTDQLEQFDNERLYVSPINQWIEASCARFDSFGYNLLFPNSLVFQFSFIHEQITRHSCLMIYVSLSLFLTKHKKKQFGIFKMQEWFHWLYHYT